MKEFIQSHAVPAHLRRSLSLGTNSGAGQIWVSCQERFFGFLGQPGFCSVRVLADGYPNIASTIYAAISLIATHRLYLCCRGAKGLSVTPWFQGWCPPG